jgi:hypothetical protein
MKRTGPLLWLALGTVMTVMARAPSDRPEPVDPQVDTVMPSVHRLDGKTPAERAAALVRHVATCKPPPEQETYPKAAAPAYAARLLLGVDTRYALERLDAAVRSRLALAQRASVRQSGNPLNPPGLDPFDKVALVNTYFLCKDKIPRPTALKIRDYAALYAHKVWRGYGAMNYRLMMDGAGYLAAEEWPELVDADDLSAPEIRQATGERLFGYFDTICRSNFDEYGAPIYLAVDLSAVRMLAEFARDPEMRKRAALTLDAMLLDIACTWNQGYNVGSASRAKYWYSADTSPDSMASTAAAAWIFFGARRPVGGVGWAHSFWMAAPGSYELPEPIMRLAQARTQPFTHRASVPASGASQVRRMTFHSPNYSLASQWDQAPTHTSALYKEARRNLLKWVSDKPSSTFAVCMENPHRPYRLAENRANRLGYGENPFSQYLQHEGTLIGVYAVPSAYPYYRLYAPFTRRGAIVKRLERAGWVFCHNGSMLMAFRSVQPHTWGAKPWEDCDLLWCNARTNGWVIETSEVAPFAGGGVEAELNRFADAVLRRTRLDVAGLEGAVPRLCYTSLAGRTLDLTWRPHAVRYTDQAKVDGRVVDYLAWPQLQNPWVIQQTNSPHLTLTLGGRRLEYDFAKWTRTLSNPR